MTCGRCRRAHYCSTACQKADWPRHKPECRAADAVAVPLTADLHPAAALFVLGIDQLAKKLYAAAQQSFEQALVLFEALLGPIHTTVAACCHVLALALHAQKAFDQAASLCQRALAINEKGHGPDHPDVAYVLSSWGNMLFQQGHFAQALAVFQRALAIFEATLGPNHVEVAVVLFNIAVLLGRQPETRGQARALFKRARDIDATSRPDLSYHSLAAKGYAHMRATQPCRTCGQKGEWKKCSLCQNEWYCSAACQKADWRRHKTECRADDVAAPAKTAAPAPGV